MYEQFQEIQEDTLYIILYSIVTAMNALASIYLLLRRGNAFAADITPPVRLRRWTAAFFAVLAIGHLWYIPAMMFDSREAAMVSMLIGALLDCMLVIPLVFVVMLCMLQDRRRSLWPIGVMVAPLAVGMIVCIITRSDALLPWVRGYFLPGCIGFMIYMVTAVRQYGRWRRDNFADLVHKEVWQSFVALAVMTIMFGYYVAGFGGIVYEYIIQVFGLFLIFYLLWRVETLSDLSIPLAQDQPETEPATIEAEDVKNNGLSQTNINNVETLLQQHCIDTQLYLQHDLTLPQLAQIIGTNRLYLSQYFSSQNTNYNAYINDLRIRHFVSLYREAVAAKRSTTAQQLANECGYRSYSTFTLAFKQRMGQSVTAWMRDSGE
jgi:AraC-like DNA-binding protein